MSPTTQTSARPVAAVVASVVSVQTGAALAKGLFPVLGSSGTVAVRVLAAAVLLPLVVRPRVRGVPGRHLALAAGLGLLLVCLNLTFYASIARIPLGVSVTIEFAGPLAVAVLGSRRALDLLWVGLAATGVVLLTGGGRLLLDGSLDPVGVGLAVLAGAGWAGYILLTKRVTGILPGVHGLAIGFVVAAVVIALPVGVLTASDALLRPEVIGTGVLVGVLSSALPAALEMAALRRMATATFGVLMSLEPVGAALAGLVVLGERLAPAQWAAVLVVCLASAGAAWSARPRRASAPAGDDAAAVVVGQVG